MIRFCSIDVHYESYENLDRNKMVEYFSLGHMDEIIFVVDANRKYKGKITYHSLDRCTNILDAIVKDHVTLDENIWGNARSYFAHYKFELREHVILPVLDRMERLICFAYEDSDANREIRMLRELMETPGALQFSDIYPEYKCVKIFEFNELAFFFAKYLESQHIAVQVMGDMWQEFYPKKEYQILDCQCFMIYAEGTESHKKINWVENLLKSVSVEFECIDVIYEANIKNGIIKDAKGGITEVLEYLREKEEIVLFGAGREELIAYDFLLKNGIEISCFVDTRIEEQSHKIFGKRILSRLDARESYKNAIFIECVSKYSSWGEGRIDYYDYIGYKRNERFFLLRDYIELPENSLVNILRSRKIILAGDVYLCSRLYEYFRQNDIYAMGFLDILIQCEDEDVQRLNINKINIEDIDSLEVTCLLVLPEYFRTDHRQKEEEIKKQIIVYFKNKGISDYAEYFSSMLSFINIEKNCSMKYSKDLLMPKRIILGSIESCSGNEFIRGLLDSHPSILMIYYSNLNSKLFWLCIRLSVEDAVNILPLFWKIYEEEGKGDYAQRIYRPDKFTEKMQQLLTCGDKFTSQELFVMFHIAYMHMCGLTINDKAINDMVIYWEPHHTTRQVLEECVNWLGTEKVACDIINLVRNACMKNGSLLKGILSMDWVENKISARYLALCYRSIDKKNYEYGKRMVIRFEDLKREPKKILLDICDEWEIAWSDSLLMTTHFGDKLSYDNGDNVIYDFDLKPVYNSYEVYFSEFDRLRIMIVTAPWQRKYGYPYVEISQFSRKEIQEMFSKRFRFESMITYNNSESKFEIDLEIQNKVRAMLQRVRALEFLSKRKYELNENLESGKTC